MTFNLSVLHIRVMKYFQGFSSPAPTCRKETDAWEILDRSPGWIRDRVIAVDYFQSRGQTYNLAEVVLTEAIPTEQFFSEFFLSLLLPLDEAAASNLDPASGDVGRRDQRAKSHQPGNLVFGAAGAERLLTGGGPFRSIMLTIEKSAWYARMERLGDGQAATLDVLRANYFRDDVLEVCLKWFLDMHRRAAVGMEQFDSDDILDRILLRLLTLAKSQRSSVSPREELRPESVRRTVEYMHAYCERQLPREQLAMIAGVSPCYFTRLFAKAVGETPKRYLLNLRLEKAKRMLQENSNVSLAEVSAASGFWNASHLCREFGRCVGVSPHVYRRYFERSVPLTSNFEIRPEHGS
ncbi:helix-turn-helix domain-containing protein [Blastopirellula marina]|nr:helix-turn-helix domain-containing protein [Blastopirellula marina]